MEKSKIKKSQVRRTRNDIKIVVKPVYVGGNDMTEVFEKVALDNVKKMMGKR